VTITELVRAEVARRVREEGLSYREVGRQVGVEHTTIFRFLGGGRRPSGDLLDRLWDWLGWGDPRADA
jgi:hypothetical protein